MTFRLSSSCSGRLTPPPPGSRGEVQESESPRIEARPPLEAAGRCGLRSRLRLYVAAPSGGRVSAGFNFERAGSCVISPNAMTLIKRMARTREGIPRVLPNHGNHDETEA